jgi:hypothetical protein
MNYFIRAESKNLEGQIAIIDLSKFTPIYPLPQILEVTCNEIHIHLK